MNKIEKMLQSGLNLRDFLNEYGCDSKEDLFKLLRKNFSRKTVLSYIKWMEKNPGIMKQKRVISNEEINKLFLQFDEKNNYTEVNVEVVTEEKPKNNIKNSTKKQGIMGRFLKFFQDLR